jgi:hypothetical protein
LIPSLNIPTSNICIQYPNILYKPLRLHIIYMPHHHSIYFSSSLPFIDISHVLFIYLIVRTSHVIDAVSVEEEWSRVMKCFWAPYIIMATELSQLQVREIDDFKIGQTAFRHLLHVSSYRTESDDRLGFAFLQKTLAHCLRLIAKQPS